MSNENSSVNLARDLGLKFPLFWNDWAIEPGAADLIIYKVLTSRPKVIVELGGGLSTLIISKVASELGLDFRLYSIDSDEVFINETKKRLEAEGLNNKSVSFIYAPISKQKFNGVDYNWYSLEHKMFDFKNVDLLLVDGPPGSLNKYSRYPAVPFFNKYLLPGSSILLDDSNRPDEKEIIELWSKELGLSRQILRHSTGRGISELVIPQKK